MGIYSIGNGVAKELTYMTHGHELSGGGAVIVVGSGGTRQRGSKREN